MKDKQPSSEQELEEMRKAAPKIIQQIAQNYIHLEESITSQLRMAAGSHHVTSGTFREDIWKSLFEQIIPRKFSIEQSVFIIDSHGLVSKEVDLAIFDEQYTPYIFRLGRIKYIPIEAVAVVVQCKSNNIHGRNKRENLRTWSKSITNLKTSLKSVARIHTGIAKGEYDYILDKDGQLRIEPEKLEKSDRDKLAQTSTRPIQILCHTKDTSSSKYDDLFDIVIHPEGERLRVEMKPDLKDLPSWYDSLNHKQDPRYEHIVKPFDTKEPSEDFQKALQVDNYKVYKDKARTKEIGLLSLTFQLNQLLMLINNPILFPHMAYVDMFNTNISK
ncbi:DUF6602 domain-containing protein [Paenibacillus riograndensis]|uniref:DUF6602 domain-containing protein n=3 Tax=Paenibacillus riograndensis TaxID=483937 RepID=A0A0E4H7W3_9BACL|nr:DUF6602 domain-containing protein [Paenibacillus riograndensis]CQR53507.1 hypothetical protein PRIO_1405 [Paenibacillus riograndensis SBR5]